MKYTTNTLQIPEMFCQIAPPTAFNTLVNCNTNERNSHTHPSRQISKPQPIYGISTLDNAYRLNTHPNIATTQMDHSNHPNKQIMRMETWKNWIWYLQPFEEPENSEKITGTTKYSTSINNLWWPSTILYNSSSQHTKTSQSTYSHTV